MPADIHDFDDFLSLEGCLANWHREKKRGLRMDLTIKLTEEPTCSITDSATVTSTAGTGIVSPSQESQGDLMNQLVTILEQGLKKDKQTAASATASQRLNLPEKLTNEILAGNPGPLISFSWPCKVKLCTNFGGTCWIMDRQNELMPQNYHPVDWIALNA
jgi:hypothetical protein